MALRVDILTPEKSLFQGEATAVQFPGTEGLFQVLTDHAPIMASLAQGSIARPSQGAGLFIT
jgi:F-type H+-transporting ATPase subunit epsilon